MLRLLVLFPKRIFNSKMSSVRRHAIELLLARDDIEVTLSGQGWEGYNTERTLRENIKELAPRAHAIFWYKPLGMRDVKPLRKPMDRDIPAVCAYNEAYWKDWGALRECRETRTDLVICHHKMDIPRFDDGQPHVPLVEWIPHAASVPLYTDAARSWPGRDIPCYVTGNLSRDIYPLRCKFADLIREGSVPGKIRPHPGYKLSNLDACDKQAADYAVSLGKTQLAMVCASKYNYGLAKYVEAAMAGACLIGDCPPDFEDTLGQFMIRVDPKMSQTDLRQMVTKALADPQQLETMAAMGQQTAMRFHGMERYTAQLMHRIYTLVGAKVEKEEREAAKCA